MKLKRIGVLSVLLVAFAALILTLQTHASPGRKDTNATLDAVPDFSALSTPVNAEDRLPQALISSSETIGHGGLALDSVRLLGRGEQATYWVARDKGENVCLLIQLPGGSFGHACGDAELFNSEGIGVALEDMQTSEFIEVHLLPDRAVLTATAKYVGDAPNVIVVSPTLSDASDSRIEVPTRTGEPVSFMVLGQVPRDQL